MSIDKITKEIFNDPEIGERLKLLCLKIDIKPSNLAKKMGFTTGFISEVINANKYPGTEFYISLRKQSGVNLHWLLTGEGEMFEQKKQESASKSPIFTKINEGYVHIPLYEVSASAGMGALVEQELVENHIIFLENFLKDLNVGLKDLAIIRVVGDSMYPTIEDGDKVMVQLAENQFRGDGIYVIRLAGTVFAKRLQKLKNGGFSVISDNPRYKEQVIEPNEGEQFSIIGKVIWSGGKL